MSAFKIDGTFTTASAIGQLARSYPLGDRDPTAILYSQPFMVFTANYAAPVLGSTNGTYATAYCIGDVNFEPLGQGLVTYTRQWATVPASRNEFGSFAFQFPGLYGTLAPPYNAYWDGDIGDGRDPVAKTVVSRLRHEFYLCTTGQTYETPQEIPVLKAFAVSLVGNADAVMPYCLPAGIFGSDTVPTKEDYQADIAAATELVAEDSTIERYLGLIYSRITRYVKAV